MTILLVDPDPKVREAATELCRDRGLRVISAEDAEGALRATHGRKVDFIFVDPARGGRALIDLLRALDDGQLEATRVVAFVSGLDAEELDHLLHEVNEGSEGTG